MEQGNNSNVGRWIIGVILALMLLCCGPITCLALTGGAFWGGTLISEAQEEVVDLPVQKVEREDAGEGYGYNEGDFGGGQNGSGDANCDQVLGAVGAEWLFDETQAQDGRADMCDPDSVTLHTFLTANGSPYQSLTNAFFPKAGHTFTAADFRHLQSPVSIHCSGGYDGLHGVIGIDQYFWGVNEDAEMFIGQDAPEGCMVVEYFGDDFVDATENRTDAQEDWVDLREALENNR
ncbi:hypothetical protein H6763_01785 [Candidatus Nomurabacteria bacterium]|nr:hypothetical protein [Candidatus Nomurabacteria bacterium]MCB9803538.1 hypothetical protein [Candidatus Nomurabacteria bacterium]